MRSIERAQDLGEVFTPPHLVNRMLDTIGSAAEDYNLKVLEPGCGNGNFLVEIFHRRLNFVLSNKASDLEMAFLGLQCLTSIYGIDIDKQNVRECRARLFSIYQDFLKKLNFRNVDDALKSSEVVLAANIVEGDALKQAKELLLIEYTREDKFSFSRQLFFLEEPERDLFFIEPLALQKLPFLGRGK